MKLSYVYLRRRDIVTIKIKTKKSNNDLKNTTYKIKIEQLKTEKGWTRLNLVANNVVSHEWRKDRIVITTWSYGSWIYDKICHQCLSPQTLWVRTPLRRGVLDTKLCDKVCLGLTAGRWFSLGTLGSSANKTDGHEIAEILLKVALNIIALAPQTEHTHCHL